MAELKTTPDERAALRNCMQPGTLDHAVGLAPKAALMLLDDIDTLLAEVERLRADRDALRAVAYEAGLLALRPASDIIRMRLTIALAKVTNADIALETK